jgi:hypothetical protein
MATAAAKLRVSSMIASEASFHGSLVSFNDR